MARRLNNPQEREKFNADARKLIAKRCARGNRVACAELAEEMHVTQTQMRRVLNAMISDGVLQYEGNTRNTRYYM